MLSLATWLVIEFAYSITLCGCATLCVCISRRVLLKQLMNNRRLVILDLAVNRFRKSLLVNIHRHIDTSWLLLWNQYLLSYFVQLIELRLLSLWQRIVVRVELLPITAHDSWSIDPMTWSRLVLLCQIRTLWGKEMGWSWVPIQEVSPYCMIGPSWWIMMLGKWLKLRRLMMLDERIMLDCCHLKCLYFQRTIIV
jgi:hypothetical protein